MFKFDHIRHIVELSSIVLRVTDTADTAQANRAQANRAQAYATRAETTQVRWLDHDERAAWLALSGLVMKLPGALDAQLQEDAGLSFFEYMVLAMLSEQSDRSIRMSDLAAMTNSSPSRLSHVARRLEDGGYLERSRDCSDARSINAVLTDAGYAKVVQSAPGHVEHVRKMVIDALTPRQLGELQTIGRKIMAEVDPGWCPPP
jgi:DNA-binding MarR family transcriptional regulator